ncbi:MAG: PKD domain-containing protein [Acidithiobacillales bacterium]
MIPGLRRLVLPPAILVLAAAAGHVLRADVVVPSAGYTTGAGGADFRTNVRIYNPTGLPVLVTPVFYRQANGGAGITAATVTQGSFTVPARGQIAFDDIIGGFFNQARGSFGPVRFQTSVPLVVSSGTNNENGCGNGSISGQWIPGLDTRLAASAGALVQLASSTDPATGYRSNVVFVNPSDLSTATVTATLRRGDGSFLALALFQLGPNGFKQVNNFRTDFAPAVSTTDTNLFLEYASDNPVFAYASVINNASGDPFAVVAVSPPSGAAFATISYEPASPAVDTPVSFTAAATNGPTSLSWTWGDGSPAETGPDLTRQHTYAAAGAYRVILTVTNDSGGSTVARDVVVGGGGTPPPHY